MSAAISERQANAQPCFIPLIKCGSDAGKITWIHRWNGPEPIVRAARAKIGEIVRTPVSVAITTDQTVPMITTKSIAPSVCPNHSNARGTQQTLGNVCRRSEEHTSELQSPYDLVL